MYRLYVRVGGLSVYVCLYAFLYVRACVRGENERIETVNRMKNESSKQALEKKALQGSEMPAPRIRQLKFGSIEHYLSLKIEHVKFSGNFEIQTDYPSMRYPMNIKLTNNIVLA